ncbi:bacillopeptidase F isoform X2 [Folsomia candida]|uniref:bacillopeptidase F isoform X2 n=1 Tax=Folsomia candida TaxID=158441 RepID=UPI0016054769|nr:bacillopeptidase F isoform X2 [Folsomia candida]
MRVTGTRPVTRGNPTNLLISTLQGLTSAAQAPFVSVAEFLGLETQQFWGSNIILVKNLTPSKLSSLAATPGDFIIRKQHTAYVDSIVEGHEFQTLNSTQNPSWGIARIRASDAWAVTNGTGIVVGIIDTGVNVGHEALAGGYAGAWSDPWYGTDGPTDTHGHGTHCAGTILGRANGIGVAPGATWVACRGLNDQAGAVETTLTHCAEWMLGANPRPHIVSNSWVYSSGVNWYNPQIAAWRNAGITPVFVLGNAGPACGTAQSPGDQENVISFGATTDTDAVASFSSRGPTPHGQIKPDFSAPGILIVSAGTGSDNYVSMSGTSMATLHAAGAVDLGLT